MTWLESWEGSYSGDWYGSSTPEPPGSMRATLCGSSSVSAKLTAEGEKKKGGSSKHRKAILRDDEELLLCISHFMCIASNN